MLKNLGNLASMLKQAQQMQTRMAEIQEGLAAVRVEGAAGGGMVRVEADGQQKIIRVSIEESLLSGGDGELLEELVTAATNQALERSRQAQSAEMSKLAEGVDLPGLGDALSQMGLG